MDKEVKEYVTKDTIARLFNLTGRRIEQLVQDGVIDRVKTEAGVRFELEHTIQKYIKHLSDKANGRKNADTVINLKEQKLRAEVALKESQGELHRLRTEIAAGKYISVEEVKADYSRFFVVFKNFALSIPSKMAGRLSGFIDPVDAREMEKDMGAEIKKLLNNFVSRAVVEEPEPDDMEKPKKRGRPPKNAKK